MDHFNNLSYSEPFPQNLTFSMRFVTSNPTQVPKVKTVVNKCFSGLSAIFCQQISLSAIKGSSDPIHFSFEMNVGKSRIRHISTLNLNDIIFNRY